MAQYRKKPVVIEAFQWTGDVNQKEDPEWIVQAIKDGTVTVATQPYMGTAYLLIKTLEGVMTASAGDFVIKGIKGEIYPCKPDIFGATYEAVE